MKSYIQKLADRYQGQLDDQADDYISRGVRAAARMEKLIEDLLAFSRVRTHGRGAGADAVRGAASKRPAPTITPPSRRAGRR